MTMTCRGCKMEIDEDDSNGLGWIRHSIATRELEEIAGGDPIMHTINRTIVWTCSLDCELEFLRELHNAAGGIANDLDQIDRLWTPGKD